MGGYYGIGRGRGGRKTFRGSYLYRLTHLLGIRPRPDIRDATLPSAALVSTDPITDDSERIFRLANMYTRPISAVSILVISPIRKLVAGVGKSNAPTICPKFRPVDACVRTDRYRKMLNWPPRDEYRYPRTLLQAKRPDTSGTVV